MEDNRATTKVKTANLNYYEPELSKDYIKNYF